MLKLYFYDETEHIDECIKDVEEAFSKLELSGSKEEKAIIDKIEHGKYNDKISFIDRFGFKLYTSELSTGCKAALVVLHNQDKIVNTVECGLNALNAIVNICKDGKVLLLNTGVTFVDFGEKVDIQLDEYRFTSIDRLNTYIQDERPFGLISGDMEGVEHV